VTALRDVSQAKRRSLPPRAARLEHAGAIRGTIAKFERGLAKVAEARDAERLFEGPDYLVRVDPAAIAAAYQTSLRRHLGPLGSDENVRLQTARAGPRTAARRPVAAHCDSHAGIALAPALDEARARVRIKG
jgi:hypothetical protein